jgi:multiple sugar transport system permease protein
MWVKKGSWIALHVVVILAAVAVAFPILWMISQSLMTEQDIHRWPPHFLPPRVTLANYWEILFEAPDDLPVVRWLLNSVFVASSSTALVIIVSSMAAYGFARLKFPFRDKLFYLILATMMVPSQTTVIPIYLFMRELKFIDTYHALIWPAGASVFPVFMLRQFFLSIPQELEDAAYVDGCTKFGTFVRIILPMAKSALITLVIFTFLQSWNDLFWPLIVLNRAEMRTLPVGLTVLIGQFWSKQGLIMASAAISSLPVLLVYVLLQRYILEGMAFSGFGGR